MSESRERRPPLESLPAKWRAEYRRVLALTLARYAGQWGRAECEYQIHLLVVNGWRQEQQVREPIGKACSLDEAPDLRLTPRRFYVRSFC
jgi:hypothetical protein